MLVSLEACAFPLEFCAGVSHCYRCVTCKRTLQEKFCLQFSNPHQRLILRYLEMRLRKEARVKNDLLLNVMWIDSGQNCLHTIFKCVNHNKVYVKTVKLIT